MPTGVPIRDLADQLLAAAERVLRRDGPGALTSRAVTTEAGVAKGVLHRHFADFDTFLAALVLTHLERLDLRSAQLRASAGTATPVDNLAYALADVLDPGALRIVGLVCSRPALLERLRLITPAGIPLLAEATRAITAYLTAERGLGRIALEADVDTLALAVVGGAHLLAADRDGPAPGPDDLRAVVTAVVGGVVRQPPHGPRARATGSARRR